MAGKMIEFRANGRTAPGYLATPDGGSGPGIIVIQEWWGLVDHIRQVADRFAAAGFVALAPDLYHGESTTSPDEAGRKMMALNIAEAGKDLAGAADHLLSLDAVSPKKLAALGFCMGGQLALFAATEHADKVSAAVDFYGIHPNVKLDFGRLKGPVLAHFGKQDEFVKEADARALAEEINQLGRQHRRELLRLRARVFQRLPPRGVRRGRRQARVGSHARLLEDQSRLTRAAALYFVASTVVLVAPVYTWFGNHVEPRVFGLPWSLCYVLGVIATNFIVLALLYRYRVIDDDG